MGPESIETQGIQAEKKTLSDPEKFGNPGEICQILEKGRIVSVVNIDDIRPELINTHSNEVDLAVIEADFIPPAGGSLLYKHINTALLVELEARGHAIQAVFKPFCGERDEIKTKLGIAECYKRERAAYLLDQFLGFGIVPPTVIRKLENDIGSLQLYIPPEIADTHDLVSMHVDFEIERSGIDWKLIAAFDYIAANWERRPANWLVNKKDPRKLYAIDHGLAFYSPSLSFERRGPRLNLTYNNIQNKPIDTPLPFEILERLKDSLARQEELVGYLEDLIPNNEIKGVITRIADLVKAERFL